MPGMALLMEGAIQQAPQPGRQFTRAFPRRAVLPSERLDPALAVAAATARLRGGYRMPMRSVAVAT
jgi:hypothetical protein